MTTLEMNAVAPEEGRGFPLVDKPPLGVKIKPFYYDPALSDAFGDLKQYLDELPQPANKVHWVRRYYNNNEFKENFVRPEDFVDHVRYNLTMRPGTALFVHGHCVSYGYLGHDRCAAFQRQLLENPVVRDTYTPYLYQ